MLVQGQVGPQTTTSSLSSGTQPPLRVGNMGELIVSNLNDQHYEATYRGAKFYGSNGATPTVTTVALATTYTGLCLLNPAASGVNLVIDRVGYSFLVVFPAAATIGLMVGYSAAGIVTYSPAASSGSSSLIGSSGVSKGKCALSATLVGTPVLHTVFAAGLTGAISTTPDSGTSVDMGGGIILAPGGYAAVYTSTISGAAALCASFEWIEVPL